MITTVVMGIMAVFLAYLGKYKNLQIGLKLSFALIFVYLAVRYNFGNDYKSYFDKFIEINSYASLDIFDKSIHVEAGWILLCKLFKPFGFFAMIAVLALFNCVIYYDFVKKYVPKKHYWIAVFIYIFTPGLMLTHASAMRQSLAIGLFIFSIRYLLKKDAIRYFLCVAIAWFMHSSALILLPVYLLSFINRRINRTMMIVIISVFVLLFVFARLVMPYLNQFISSYFEKYEAYQEAGAIGTGLGVLYVFVLFTLILYYERLQNRDIAFIFKIAIISFLFIPLSLLILLVGRMAMYFAPATIIAYPIVQINFKKRIFQNVFIGSLIFMTTYFFIQFFQSETYKVGFGTYQTIFSSPKLY